MTARKKRRTHTRLPLTCSGAWPIMRVARSQTLAETTGGASDRGAAAVGLVGTIPVEFTQGNDTVSTMAFVGQPLSEVAAQAGQFIKYKCRKGECGTCAVRVDGEWIRTCTVKVRGMRGMRGAPVPKWTHKMLLVGWWAWCGARPRASGRLLCRYHMSPTARRTQCTCAAR